jgi:ketosteroid isomerase-like protein
MLVLNCLLSPLSAQEASATPGAPNPFHPILANPFLVQQVKAQSASFDDAFNKHDIDAVLTLFTTNATQVSPVGTFVGREGLRKFYGDLFHNLDPHDRATKIDYVYAFGGDLCALGGWVVTVHGTMQAGGLPHNQFISRHSRKAIRARCSITQRLLGEIFKASQICDVSISSISRSIKTSAIRWGSLARQSLNVSQNSVRCITTSASGLHSRGPVS